MATKTNLLSGAIDLHAHTSPALYERPLDDRDLAELVSETGMRGFVLKDHDSLSTGRAYHLSKQFTNLTAYGSIVLNRTVGGINPQVVQAALHYGAKIIWFPTNHAQWHIDYFALEPDPPPGRMQPLLPGPGLSILDGAGNITEEAAQIIDLVADADACLASGHLSLTENRVLLKEAVKRGASKVLLTHINWGLTRVEKDVQRELISSGAYLEYVSLACVSHNWAEQEPQELAGWIDDLGSERLVLSSDLGQLPGPRHTDGLQLMSEKLLSAGVSTDDLQRMLHYNPAVLLGLEE